MRFILYFSKVTGESYYLISLIINKPPPSGGPWLIKIFLINAPRGASGAPGGDINYYKY